MVYVSEGYPGCWVKNRLQVRLEPAMTGPDGNYWTRKQEAYSPREPKWSRPVMSSSGAYRLCEAFSKTPSLVFDPRLPASSSQAFIQFRGQEIL